MAHVTGNIRIKVVLVDDHPMMREGLVTAVNAQADMEVVGQASSGLEATQVALKTMPDVIVLDIMMPDFSGLDIIQELKRHSSSCGEQIQVVMFSMVNKESLILRALNAGAFGYVTKSSPSSEVIKAIRQVYRGSYYLSTDISDNVVKSYLNSHKTQFAGSGYDQLSEREQEIFYLLVEGNSNRAISTLLSLSERTVEKHRANIMAKLDVHSYRELIQYAIQIGIIESGPDTQNE